jgi:hypothetical protein
MREGSDNRKAALFRMPRNDATARVCNGSNMQVKQIARRQRWLHPMTSSFWEKIILQILALLFPKKQKPMSLCQYKKEFDWLRNEGCDIAACSTLVNTNGTNHRQNIMAQHWKTLLFQHKAYVSNIMIAYLNLYQISKGKKCMSF